ncbi:MAG: tetratricopeptide repeat protein [Gammaproteobacteria bacterium]
MQAFDHKLTGFNNRSLINGLACLWLGVSSAHAAEPLVVQDLHYGEVLFSFYQEDYFPALTRLIAARDTGKVPHHAAEAELLQGGMLLSWGQHKEAGEIFDRLLVTEQDQSIRDRAWFYLGKVRFQRGLVDEAATAFTNIEGTLPDELDAERDNLLAQVFLARDQLDEAVALLQDWDGPDDWAAYARFNLGVALVRRGDFAAGAGMLNDLGTMDASAEEFSSLKDRSNVALGYAYVQQRQNEAAKPVLQRVRLNGPFSNKALLGMGWADSIESGYRRALVPWLELSSRDVLDSAVQESLLAVPYAFAQLDANRRAVMHYRKALQVYETEIKRLDRLIADKSTAELLGELLATSELGMGGWSWQLSELPEDPRVRYLYFVIASHAFQESLKNYRDLLALDAHLADWEKRLDAFEHMVDARKLAYAQRAPLIEAGSGELNVSSVVDQQKLLAQRFELIKKNADVIALGSEQEQAQWRQLLALEKNPAWNTEVAADAREKQRLLKGVLYWDLYREFKFRAWQQGRQLEETRELVAQSVARRDQFDEAWRGAPVMLDDFAARIAGLAPRIRRMRLQVRGVLDQQSGVLNAIAVDEFQRQRERLATYRAQARFALANVFDRTAMVQD